LALLFVIGAIVLLATTGTLFSSSPIVVVAHILGLGLAVWARHSFPSDAFRVTAIPGGGAVIQRGPYRVIRHPMYSAALLVVWASILGHVALWTAFVGVVVTSVVVIRVIMEERLLRARFPAYAAYAASTKALVPYLV
jgi:protein-S-isoprenylcysteine O-methyltransferase Ste14